MATVINDQLPGLLTGIEMKYPVIMKSVYPPEMYTFQGVIQDSTELGMGDLAILDTSRYLDKGTDAATVRPVIILDTVHNKAVLEGHAATIAKGETTQFSADDVVDYANTTVDEMEIYEIKGDSHIKEMVSILRKAAREISEAVKILGQYPKIASEHALQAKAYENSMEKAYHRALADLFKGADTVYMLKMREIYRHLSNAADRGDEAANIISSIVMKHS